MAPRLLVGVVLLSLGLAACQPAALPAASSAKVAAEFSLVDQDGQTVRLADMRGKVVLMDFIYTSCTDACPTLQAILEGVRRGLGEAFPNRVNLVTITYDPEYDTPQVMKRYAAGAGWDMPGWHFLTGPVEEIKRVTAAYGSVYEKVGQKQGDARAFAHNILIVLVDQGGMLRQQYLGPDLGASQKILEDVRALLK